MPSFTAPRSGRLVFVAWLAATLLASSIEIATARSLPADATDYFYDANGRRLVTAAEDELLVHVTLAGNRQANGRPGFLPQRSAPDHVSPAVEKLETRLEQRGFFVTRGVDATELQRDQRVDWALPVLYRAGSDVPIYQTDRVVVRFKDQVTLDDARQIAESLGCDAERRSRGMNRYIFVVRDPVTVSPLAVANSLHEAPDLTHYAHPDFFLPKVAYAPPTIDDPLYHDYQWHLDGDVLKGADANSDVNVEVAWDTANGPAAEGSPTVRVSILDECVEKWHPDLLPNWAAGLDLDNDPPDNDPSPDSGQRHGTSCAGVAVARGNTIGVRGAAPFSGLIGVKFFGASVAEMAEGYYFSMDPNDDGDHSDGAAIMSNSWGFADGTLLPDDVVNAINTVATTGRNGLGCLVLFASANNDHTVNGVQSLSSLQTVLTVGGTNSHAKHTEFSDVGPEVAIATPTNDRGDDGVRFGWLDITTTDNTGDSGYNGLPDLDYTDEFGGTSSATPLAAGILALIISQDEMMTAAEARAILEHTAVRIDEPYGRFDGITGHSHRFGYGRADAGAAVVAAHAGLRWPDRITTLNLSPTGSDIVVTWSTPLDNYSASVLVRSSTPFAWMPTDGESYAVSDEVTPGVEVIYTGAAGLYTDVGAAEGAFFYAVYPVSSANLYGFGAKAHVIRNGVPLFYDNSEQPDPGWSHGGPGDEWTRGTPTSGVSLFGQSVYGSGPLGGLRGMRAIGGDNCWGTDLASTYDANADAYLDTPLINLTGVAVPVFLEYYDWCLMETFYDTFSVEVVDADGQLLGYLDPDVGGDYDWTQRVYDLTPYAGQAIRVRFHIISDDVLQRDGWFIDEVRVTVAADIPLPPTADNVYAETPENTSVSVNLVGADPNPGTVLAYIIESVPAHGSLFDPNGGRITSVPYTVLSNGYVVDFAPDSGYQGPDEFIYRAFDGGLESNDATVRLSVGTPLLVHDFPLDFDPGWLTEGDWEFGAPQGIDGDPLGGYTGLNVYGYNLAGEYPDDLPPTHLTTLPFNCTGLSRVTLDFARWLGVEASSFDNATVSATNDGVTWHTVWAHAGSDLEETAWSLHSCNLGEVADDQPFVQIRWTMGPTDANTTFCGWNLDDIQLLAIGTPAANQPPLALPALASTAKNHEVDVVLEASDQDEDPLEYTITALPVSGTLTDPNGAAIEAVPYTLLAAGDTVIYAPGTDFAGTDTFSYQADDGELGSNVAPASVDVLDSAGFPFLEDFEAGSPLSAHWTTYSTGAGRIRVTDQDGPLDQYHVAMDSGRESTSSANELTLAVDLEGESIVLLRYEWRDYDDETHALPESWTGSVEGDGVAISADGVTWYKVADLFDSSKSNEYQRVTVDLDLAAAAAGLTYNKAFRIRFQQYDNHPIPSDGVALDNIRVFQGTGDPVITTAALPAGRVGEAYNPVIMTVSGGDPPLLWSNPVEYFEESLGESQFSPIGIAQGWTGDDSVFTYTMPFTFPFFGEDFSEIKVASDGWINFGNYVGSTYNNSEVLLSFNKRIAVLWDDLRTDQGGDIYVDESLPGQVTIRWDADTRSGLYPCNFAATLFDTGAFQLHYGQGNTPISATVGVSYGDGVLYFLSAYDAQPNLNKVASLAYDWTRLPPGLIMTSEGVVAGTPTAAGTYPALFRVDDDSQRSDTKLIPITIWSSLFGDYDQDSDVDWDDFAEFYDCLLAAEPTAQCVAAFDHDDGLDVNLSDFGAFQNAFAAD